MTVVIKIVGLTQLRMNPNNEAEQTPCPVQHNYDICPMFHSM